MNLGTGGMDASIGAIAQSIAGFEAWGVNAKMLFSGQDEAKRYASALRTLYSVGGAAGDERNLFERILAGQTDVVEQADGDYKARTTYDAGSGTHTISLGADALSDGSRFGMNILLAHEAYRNGVDDGAEGQAYETLSALLGHIQAAGALGATYGLGALNGAQLDEVRALQAAYRGDSSAIAGILGSYDSSGDYWKLLKDDDGNSFLEYDGHADIYDEKGNFLVGAGTTDKAIQTALSMYLGKSMAETAIIMGDAGMTASGTSWILDANKGKRIIVGKETDPSTTDYIFAAQNLAGIQAEILSVFKATGSVSAARESLERAWAVDDGNLSAVGERYAKFRSAVVSFYLPASRMFENGFDSSVTQGSEYYKLNGNSGNHKGIDIGGSGISGQQFNSVFSGTVAWTAVNSTTAFDGFASWSAGRDLSLETLENLLYKSKNGSYWKDSRFGGNTVEINHGFMFGSSFLNMGFSTRTNHFSSILESAGYLASGTGIGTAGNTGSSTGPHVDWNVFINDPYGKGNFIGKLYSMNFNQAYTNTLGTRYLDPRRLYDLFN